jgi:adenylosuccinate synthase
MVVEQADIDWERAHLAASIGSTAQGVGAASSRKVLRQSHDVPVRLAKDVPELGPFVDDTITKLERAFSSGQKILLEGTQGTGLSLHHGRYPFVTSRDTTVAGCLSEAGIPAGRVRKVVMVCRTYPIRVEDPDGSTSGPMTHEIDWDVVAERSGNKEEDLRAAERTSTTGRKRRVCEFDWALLRRAATLNAPTDIALTFADYLSVRNRDARRYEQLTPETINMIGEVERVAGCPVTLIGTRFHQERSVIDRRHW